MALVMGDVRRRPSPRHSRAVTCAYQSQAVEHLQPGIIFVQNRVPELNDPARPTGAAARPMSPRSGGQPEPRVERGGQIDAANLRISWRVGGEELVGVSTTAGSS